MKNIKEVMKGYDILEDEVSSYGKNIAKIDLSLLNRLENKKDGQKTIFFLLVENKGLEPLTPCVQGRCSPS